MFFLIAHNVDNKYSMKRLEEIINVNTEGNYLFSSTDKAQMMSEILDLFSVSQQRELFVKEQSKWLMANTNLNVEQIIDFEMEFINK